MRKVLCLILILGITSLGCTTTVRRPNDFSDRISSMRRIGIMPMDIKVFRLEAGGTTELMDEWSAASADYLGQAIHQQFSSRTDIDIVHIPEAELQQRDARAWDHIQSLHEAVVTSALRHSFDGPRFSSKVKNFDYTLGPEVQPLIDVYNVDAVMFVVGRNFIETTGRKFAKVVNFSAATAVSATLGSGIGMYVGGTGPNALIMAIVERESGDLIWLRRFPHSNFNLLDESQNQQIITWMLDDYFTYQP